MHGTGKSDRFIVPKKPSNNGEAVASPAETVEGRSLTKGNTPQTTAPRTQSRTGALSGLERVRTVAREDNERHSYSREHCYARYPR